MREQQITEWLDRQNIEGSRETYADALRQALAQFDSIAEMVADLRKARGEYDAEENDSRFQAAESAEERIQDDALSVEWRSGWQSFGTGAEPAEFRILLCTGGPAVQIAGEIGEHGEPEKPRLEFQGWFIPWNPVPWHMLPKDAEEMLLEYCCCFCFEC